VTIIPTLKSENSQRLRPYLRDPTIRGDLLAFVADDDIWLTRLDGAAARRLTTDQAPASDPRLSADGSLVAFTSKRDGAPEAFSVDADGGEVTRLTYFGDATTRVAGFDGDGAVVVTSATGEPFRSRTWAYALDAGGGPPRRLPFGPVTSVRWGPGGAVVLGVHQSRYQGASWKRYRGGSAAALWIDATGSGEFEPFLTDLRGQLEDPMWVGERVAFLSDHEGYGNVYSVASDGSDLRRHTDHGDFYARAAATDGSRIVYQCAGDIWMLDELAPDSAPRLLDIELSTPRSGRSPSMVRANRHIGPFSPARNGQASALGVRGSVFWLTHRDGPARHLAGGDGVRARMPKAFGRPGSEHVALVTDAEGDDAIEIIPVSNSADSARRRLGAGELGRILALSSSPDGGHLALATHDGRVILVTVETGELQTLDTSTDGDSSGLTFSPDSRWLAWSSPGPDPLRQIKLARIPSPPSPDPAPQSGDSESGDSESDASESADVTQDSEPPTEPVQEEVGPRDLEVFEATPLRFDDHSPVFMADGKYLAFLSSRTFDPLYDAQVFDMSFVAAARPYLISLAAATPSPFAPSLDGRPRPGGGDNEQGRGAAPAENGHDHNHRAGGSNSGQGPVEVTIDTDGLSERVVPVPVAPGRYRKLRASHKGLLWLRDPPWGVLGEGRSLGADGPRPSLTHYDVEKRRERNIVDSLDDYQLTGDGKSIVVKDGRRLRMQPSDERPSGNEQEDENVVEIDVSRVRVRLDPGVEWTQMFDEAARLMRDHFWVADMAGVDWPAVVARYRPLVERIATRDDLSELLWEVQGELSTSHAYESPPARPVEQERRIGHLGADFARDGDGGWTVTRILPGDTSVPGARSPFTAPGVSLSVGDVVVAVDNRPVDPLFGPSSALVGAADKPVQLTIRPADGSETREVVVTPLPDDRPLRYQAWVAGRRAAVHTATNGRVGYVHVPDMVGRGWAEFHRDLRLEVDREALVVDLRDNAGGHLSELVLEKLSRQVRAWELPRHKRSATYPADAPRGPLIAVTNEWAGSDGDIATEGFRQRGLGPVVGTRTWGGVIGIDGRYHLVDGTRVTQPRYAFWLNGLGLGLENHGAEPDVLVRVAPQDWAESRDTQLDEAIKLVLEALEEHPAAQPPDPLSEPSRAAPVLPPRPQAPAPQD
jgi:tricorn protease